MTSDDPPRAEDGEAPPRPENDRHVPAPAPDDPTEESTAEQTDAAPDAVLLLPEVREEVFRAARQFLSSIGPLPPAEELGEYEGRLPGTGHEIVADFRRRSEAEVAAAEHEQRVQLRELDLAEREQAFRERERGEDIETRRAVLRFGMVFLPAMALAAFLIVFLAPIDDDWARVAAATAFLSTIAVPVVAVLLRGRMTRSEGETIRGAVPYAGGQRPPAPTAESRTAPLPDTWAGPPSLPDADRTRTDEG